MELRFYSDLATGAPHIYEHSITESEVSEVLASPLEDRGGAEGSRVAIGRTDGGRLIRVIYVPEPRDRVFVVTAYELGPKAQRAFRRRLRRKL